MPDTTLFEEPLRPGQMWSRVLRRGQILRVTAVEGGASVAALLYNADQPLERYNMPDTLKAQHVARVTTGVALYSDMGRVLCSVVADTCGWHDTITGIADAETSRKKYGDGSYQKLRNDFYRNTKDNFLTELGKYELGKRDIVANLNLFVKVGVDEAGNLRFFPDNCKAGDYIELRAELNSLLVLSNTPHPLDPSPTYAPKPLALAIRTSSAQATAPARGACPENDRGFSLTDRYFT